MQWRAYSKLVILSTISAYCVIGNGVDKYVGFNAQKTARILVKVPDKKPYVWLKGESKQTEFNKSSGLLCLLRNQPMTLKYKKGTSYRKLQGDALENRLYQEECVSYFTLRTLEQAIPPNMLGIRVVYVSPE